MVQTTTKQPSKSLSEMTREEKEKIFNEGIQAEIKMHHAAGRYTTHGDEKGIFRLYPDGHREYMHEKKQNKIS